MSLILRMMTEQQDCYGLKLDTGLSCQRKCRSRGRMQLLVARTEMVQVPIPVQAVHRTAGLDRVQAPAISSVIAICGLCRLRFAVAKSNNSARILRARSAGDEQQRVLDF